MASEFKIHRVSKVYAYCLGCTYSDIFCVYRMVFSLRRREHIYKFATTQSRMSFKNKLSASLNYSQ